MMREPWFWRSQSMTARILTVALQPAAFLYQGMHMLRWAVTKPACAPLPVICIGNATLGGAGKTPFAMMVASLLQERGVRSCFLTRGYGGAIKGPVFVKPSHHDAGNVG
ncbi:MAG: tetraacyldisaccharide 4'-kinase, partial [Pseudomonadota bacterium]